MRRMSIPFVALIMVFSVRCSNGTGPSLGDEVKLNYGQSIVLEDGALTVEFMSVAGESRCPEGVTCVWEGNAEIRVQVSSAEMTETYALNTTLNPQFVEHQGYKIDLLSVDPYPMYKQSVEFEEYSITLDITEE